MSLPSAVLPAPKRVRLLVALSLIGGFATVAFIGWLSSAANATLTCTHYWKTTAATNDFGTRANWSPLATGTTTAATAPNNLSVVCLQVNATPSIVVTGANQIIAGAALPVGSLEIAGGAKLSINNVTDTSSINNLLLDAGGQLGGTSAVNLTGAATVNS